MSQSRTRREGCQFGTWPGHNIFKNCQILFIVRSLVEDTVIRLVPENCKVWSILGEVEARPRHGRDPK